MKDNTKLIKSVFFCAFLIAYAVGLVYLGLRLNVSNDEIFSLDTSSHNLKGVIGQAYNFEGQPPLYFIVLSLWRHLNSAIFFARLSSIIFIFLSAGAFYQFIKLITEKKPSRWLVILFLINPYIVWAAEETRLYAFILLITIGALYYLASYYINNQRRYLIYFVLLGLAGVLTQYLYIFLVVALALPVLLFKGWRALFTYALYSLPIGLLLLYNVFYTTDPMSLAYINSVSISFTDRMLSVLHTPQNLLLGLHMLDVQRVVRWAFILVFAILFAYTYLKWYTTNQHTNKTYFKIFNGSIIAGLVLLLINSVFFAYTKLDYHDRYLTVGFPLFLLIMILFQTYPVVQRSIIYGVLVLCYCIMLCTQYRYQVKEYDIRSLTKYIGSIERKDEPICFYHKVISLQFKYNYEGKNALIPLPDGLKFDSSYLNKITDTVSLEHAIETSSPTAKSYILINDRTESNFENDDDVRILNSFVSAHYRVTIDTLFIGHNPDFPLRIRRLEKKD
ncbi:MAG: glycosyltransferase family 39 protein [Bacteroidetes bacterium]|nr:glycosyltransferase family 39 protein [Bacteroidota bacterium]